MSENGYWTEVTRIKKDAKPIDDIDKFAWDDDDYETVREWHEYTPEELERMEQSRRAEIVGNAVDSLPEVQDETDAAICDLYERQETYQDEVDAAICEMYESMVGGA